MHIIFGQENLNEIGKKYVVLELDTFSLPNRPDPVTAFCVVENIPIQDIPLLENQKTLHANLIKNYGIKNWNYCEQTVEYLMGKWDGELDTFYQDVLSRVKKFKQDGTDENWTPIIDRTKGIAS